MNRRVGTSGTDGPTKTDSGAGRTATRRDLGVTAPGTVIHQCQEVQRKGRASIHRDRTTIGVCAGARSDLGVFADSIATFTQVAAEGTVDNVTTTLQVNSTTGRNRRSQVTCRSHASASAQRRVVYERGVLKAQRTITEESAAQRRRRVYTININNVPQEMTFAHRQIARVGNGGTTLASGTGQACISNSQSLNRHTRSSVYLEGRIGPSAINHRCPIKSTGNRGVVVNCGQRLSQTNRCPRRDGNIAILRRDSGSQARLVTDDSRLSVARCTGHNSQQR